MRLPLVRQGSVTALLLGTAVFAVAVPHAAAQHRHPSDRTPTWCPPAPCPPAPAPVVPESRPPDVRKDVPKPPAAEPTQLPAETFFPSLASARTVGLGFEAPQSSTGYIDSAIPRTTARFRFDSAYGNNRPDRAEFFYAKCGCFRFDPSPRRDPRAAGPLGFPETNIDYQDFSTHLEYAFSPRFSAFLELPVRLLNPDVNANTAGMADLNFGFKYALVADQDQFVTFQFRTYAPSGDADRGLGTNNVNLEPGLLVYQRLTDRLVLEGELRDWIPIRGTDFAGNVLRYGVGLSYFVVGSPDVQVAPTGSNNLWMAPVAELVGWTVLGGKALVPEPTGALPYRIPDASGDTIINAKIGVRAGFGDNHSVYVGYGRALTGEVWYKDLLRLEYRLAY